MAAEEPAVVAEAVRGWSAYELQRRVQHLGRMVATGIAVGGLTLLIDGGQRGPVIWFGLAILWASFAAGIYWAVLLGVANFRELAEVRSGYPTLRSAHQDVQELEPHTFRLVRMPGEPYISNAVRAQRLSGVPADAPPGNIQPLSQPGRPVLASMTGRWNVGIAVLGAITLVVNFVLKIVT